MLSFSTKEKIGLMFFLVVVVTIIGNFSDGKKVIDLPTKPMQPPAAPVRRPVPAELAPTKTPLSTAKQPHPTHPVKLRASLHHTPLRQQLKVVEDALGRSVTSRYDFQSTLARSNETRPHHVPYEESWKKWTLPVPERCPSPLRPDSFCVPNLGRDWNGGDKVFPVSYSMPEELFLTEIPKKDQDSSIIIPRDKGTYKFKDQSEYRAEYSRSYYCMTFKKGGWDAMRHYEIIAAGCMPYMPDIEYAPIYTMYHFPKQLVFEARRLPGVYFNCTTLRVHIDHSIFPKERYFQLLKAVMDHAKSHLTTKAMAKYALDVTGNGAAKNVLYFHRAQKGVPLRAQGNYNSWSLFYGLRSLLGADAVDYEAIPFLYHQSDALKSSLRPRLYGQGFGYAFTLPHIEVNRSGLLARIAAKEFDVIIFGDPSNMLKKGGGGGFLFYDVVSKYYPTSKIFFLHVPDIPYPNPSALGYRMEMLYGKGLVFQREIADCKYYVPDDYKDVHVEGGGGEDREPGESEMMKRCVWYHNKNCLDDVNVVDALAKWKGKYVWSLPVKSHG